MLLTGKVSAEATKQTFHINRNQFLASFIDQSVLRDFNAAFSFPVSRAYDKIIKFEITFFFSLRSGRL